VTQLDITILGIIHAKPSHAYNVEKVIEDKGIRERLDIGFSTIYSTLKKMEKSGLLDSHYHPQENLPGRRIYTITPKGEKILLDEIKKALSQPQREPSLFETGLMFGTYLSKEEIKEVLSLYDSELGRLIQTKLREITSIKSTNSIERAMLSRPLSLWQAERKWIRELLNFL
jgi:DNA-binding PadR family transcriptional regulator